MGINGTIFAYGQTGAGKTYSITGGDQKSEDLNKSLKRGILPRTLDMVFEKLIKEFQNQSTNITKDGKKQSQTINLFVSFYEIYNEKIYDLLVDDKHSVNKSPNITNQMSQKRRSHSRTSQQSKDQPKIQPHLDLREEKDGKFTIPDLRKINVQSLQEAYQYLNLGLQRRATSSTSLNNQSSRSHSVFQIYLEKTNSEGVCIRSKLRIVDLAGSEKYTIKKDLPAAEKNIKVSELTSINSSLSALGQCISALSDPLRKHIPYRNSKLTKILKDSLDENSNLALIICISPSVDSYKETLSTLQFADRAKKAILDGRNFSDSKLFQEFNQNSDSLNTILKAYQEEKAIRKELEHYVKENNNQGVIEELNRLKKQNEELQIKVKLLEQNQQTSSQQSLLKENIQQSISPIRPKQLKSCLKKDSQVSFGQSQRLISINIVNINKVNENNLEEDDQEKKKVRFAEKLDNDQSLDSDDRERIEHNLKYNDDTIFDNISIFRDLNNSGIVAHRLKDRKDVHPLKLKQLPIEDDEDEEEKQNDPQVPPKIEEENKKQESLIISKIHDPKIKEFWGVESAQKNDPKKKEYDINQDNGVSPIQKKRPNNSSQDMSKDLIELDNDNMMKNLDAFEVSKISNDPQSSSTHPHKQEVLQNFDFTAVQQADYNQSIFDAGDIFNVQDQKLIAQKNFFNEDEAQEDGMFEQNYDDMLEEGQRPQEDLIIDQDTENNQQISDSMMGLDAALETDNIPSIQIINNSQEVQNTLLLDSQSMIIEDPIKDQNLSQQIIQQIDASSIMNQREDSQAQNNQQYAQNNHQNFFSVGNNALLNQLQIFQIGQSSNANSSNVNTDVLTYSLTNTFSTIESLHDELTAIRNGLELSQKRGANILKTIHQYAREIEEYKGTQDSFDPREEYKQYLNKEVINMEKARFGSSNKKNVDIYQDEDEDSQFDIENLNVNFVRDIKGFYSRIHQEIAQLKNILVDSGSQNTQGSPIKQQTTSTIKNKSQKSSDLNTPIQKQNTRNVTEQIANQNPDVVENQLVTQSSAVSIEGIEKTQEIVTELRKEMEIILNINQQSINSYKRKRNEKNKTQKSLRVLDLLEALQSSLAQAITPNKSTNQLLRLSSETKTSRKNVREEVNHLSGNNQGNSQDYQNLNNSNNQKPTSYKTFGSGNHTRQSNQKFEYNYEGIGQKITPFNQDQSRSVRFNGNQIKFQAFQIDRIDTDTDLPLFVDNQQNISKVVVQQVDLSHIAIDNQPFNIQSIIDTKNLIQYEEMPSESISPSSVKKKEIEKHNSSQSQAHRQEQRQRTPEIFKSLAKLDESDLAPIIERDLVFTSNNYQNQQPQVIQHKNSLIERNPIQITQINNFFSQNSQLSQIQQNNSLNNQDNQEFQATLRSYNFTNDLNNSNLNYHSNHANNFQQTCNIQQNLPNHLKNINQNIDEAKTDRTQKINRNLQQNQQASNQIIHNTQPANHNLNNSDMEQNPLIINNLSTIDRKKSILGSRIDNLQMAADNTLTLIFDSDEEQEFQGDQENDDKFGGEPIIQEVDEDEDRQSKHSLIFNEEDDSKIEKNSSQGNNSQGNPNNLITSNSFQADNSLLILANNFAIGSSNKGNVSSGNTPANIFDQNSYDMQNTSQNILKNSNSLSKSIDDATPERRKDQQNLAVKSKIDKRQNKKYLLPIQSRQQSELIVQNQQPLQAQYSPNQNKESQTQSYKDQEVNKPNTLLSDNISQEESRAITSFSQERAHKSTSKTSVQKYWNQFFNNKPENCNSHSNDQMRLLKINFPQSLQTPQSIYGLHNQPSMNLPPQPIQFNQSSISMNMSASMDQIPSEQISNSKLLNLIHPPPTTMMRNIGGLNQAYSYGHVISQNNLYQPHQNSLPTSQFNSLQRTKEQMHHPSASLGGNQNLPLNQNMKPSLQISKIPAQKQSLSPINYQNSLSPQVSNKVENKSAIKKPKPTNFQNKKESIGGVLQKSNIKGTARNDFIISSENNEKNQKLTQQSALNKRKFSQGNQRS